MIRNFLQCSRKFQLDPADLTRSLKVLGGLGFTQVAIGRVLEDFPTVVIMNKGEILSIIEFLREIGVPGDNIDRVIRLYPRVLGFGVEDRLKPLLYELGDLGFSDNEVRKEIIREPRILGMELGEFSRCLQLLKTLKCREAIKEKIFQEGMLRAGFEVKLRVDCLCSHGLIRRDAFKVLWKEPRLITYDIENIEKKIDFLVHRMGYGVECLSDVPEYLGVNFEKQIVPRYNVMEYLKAKGAIDFEVGLKDLIKPSRLRFYNLYVKPYPECEKLYGRFSGNLKIRNKHPPGLWKLFKPQKFPETKEDVKNMKSFMDELV
ncbi:transcription termination factor MTERF15, mitochondrial [Senna tora]|uniref:Transcription termination factor MTERF15, mitochondrial n=1 Tax=Senna tora TaxID=362788 RepID=A0A834TI72_9FABA|nr:transcription termination factor MTERF15, mitochondrial [Senna tora]